MQCVFINLNKDFGASTCMIISYLVWSLTTYFLIKNFKKLLAMKLGIVQFWPTIYIAKTAPTISAI